MKLYFAPNSRAVRTAWLLNELGLEYDLIRFESIVDSAMRTPEFKAVNPNARVPVIEDGDVRACPKALLSPNTSSRDTARVVSHPTCLRLIFRVYLQWLHYGEGMIMGPMGNYVVETISAAALSGGPRNTPVRSLKLMSRVLQAVDHHMKDREYLVGDFTAADTITGHACMMSERMGADLTPNCRTSKRTSTGFSSARPSKKHRPFESERLRLPSKPDMRVQAWITQRASQTTHGLS